jgi:glyoxylase-like metal-dependent hydrolase (beta-lactamase superfamily II)
VRLIELSGDILGVRADNPGPLTLSGTNTWIVGRDPAWVIDPGPELDGHVQVVASEVERRGGLGGVALTHDHLDHSQAVGALRARFPGVPLAAGRGEVDIVLVDDLRVGPLRALYTPGHAPDHYAFVAGDAGFTGDTVLGEGSVFISPDPGALSGYLQGLARLRRLELDVLCPGHGPPISDPVSKLDEYVAHRLDRERRLLAGLGAGARTVDEMLDAAWNDVPSSLRPAAAVTLAAYLDKLEEDGRLPAGVERPAWLGPGQAQPAEA